jgi:hypothetical protein
VLAEALVPSALNRCTCTSRSVRRMIVTVLVVTNALLGRNANVPPCEALVMAAGVTAAS